MFYFDANATTPLHPAARAAWISAQETAWGNSSAPTALGVRAHVLLEDCRGRLAARLPAGMQVVFSGGATEGNNAVLADAKRNAQPQTGDAAFVAISALEHASVFAPAETLFAKPPVVIPANADGTADLAAAETLFADFAQSRKPLPALFSLMAVNNETGVVQPMQAARALAARYGIPFHCDASQAFGKLAPNSLREMLAGCDFVTGCAHKFGGTKGVGFVAFNPAARPRFAMQAGGGHENHRRAGTPDVAGVAAMLAALESTDADFRAEVNGDPAPADVAALARNRFEAEICAKLPGAKVNGATAPRVWNTVSLTLPDYGNLRWLKKLERRGFVAATGSACGAIAGDTADTGAPPVSRTLLAMGISPAAARRTLRLSAWREMPAEAWRELLEALCVIYQGFEAEAQGLKTEFGLKN